MTLDEAKEILKQKQIVLTKEQDLSDEGERMLYEILGTDLIFISDYPIKKRPFYHMWDREKGVGLDSISGYLDNFKYGCVPHGGLGIGVERVISKLLGITVKEASMFPKTPDRLMP